MRGGCAWRAICYSGSGCASSFKLSDRYTDILIYRYIDIQIYILLPKYFSIRKVGACPPMTRYKRDPAPSSTVTSQLYPISTVTNQLRPISMLANYLRPILMFSNHHQHQISMVASHQQHQASHPQQVPLFHQRLGFAKLLFLLLIGDLQVGITVISPQ